MHTRKNSKYFFSTPRKWIRLDEIAKNSVSTIKEEVSFSSVTLIEIGSGWAHKKHTVIDEHRTERMHNFPSHCTNSTI